MAPKATRSSQASWDGSEQNSGILAELPDHRFLITDKAHARYNSLVAEYGARFMPPLTGSEPGMEWTGTNAFIMSPELMEHFATMNRWRKEEQKP